MKKIEIYIATHKQRVEEDEIHIPIQVGAALNSERIQKVGDDTGEQISEKNPQYCELTALYWIWKNSRADIVGLEHYRRRFRISKEKICQTLAKYDIILPSVYLYRISLEEEYKKYHIPQDWDKMIEILLAEYPDYTQAVQEVFTDNGLIPYNMFIADKKICNDYCDWLFPVLEKLEAETAGEERDSYQGRYLGFLSERLFTLYIRKNRLKVYTCPVEEKQHETLAFQAKNWFGQHILNPFVFRWKKRK